MTPEQTAKLRVLANGPLWPALIEKMQETVAGMLKAALTLSKEDEAIHKLLEARAADTFVNRFTTSVETDIRGE